MAEFFGSPEFFDEGFDVGGVAGAGHRVQAHAPAPEPHAVLVQPPLQGPLGGLCWVTKRAL